MTTVGAGGALAATRSPCGFRRVEWGRRPWTVTSLLASQASGQDLEAGRKASESFQELPETFQKRPETFQELPEAFQKLR